MVKMLPEPERGNVGRRRQIAFASVQTLVVPPQVREAGKHGGQISCKRMNRQMANLCTG